MIAVINISVADIRIEPRTKSERISQGLLNEIVEVIGEAPLFRQVRFSDRYEGWIGEQFLSRHDRFIGEGPFIIKANIAPAFDGAAESSKIIAHIPYGCHLYGSLTGDFLEIQSKRWGRIYIPRSHLIDKYRISPGSGVESDDIIAEAEKFMGVPYLWGGRSFFGFDCSGFVKAVYSIFGVELPRDTKDQIKRGAEVKREEIRRGDLLFFPRHVAMAVSDTLFIHASQKNGVVAYNSFDINNRYYREDLDKSYKTARRIFT